MNKNYAPNMYSNINPHTSFDFSKCDYIKDNDGDILITGFYTKEVLKLKDAIKCGPLIPKLPSYCLDKRGYENARKLAYRKFCDISERNCNTCKNLKRIKTPSNQEFLQGECLKHPELKLCFHPDDSMHMECYESRW